jgi:hypothetical protein
MKNPKKLYDKLQETAKDMGNSYNTLQKHYNIHNPDAEAEVEAA